MDSIQPTFEFVILPCTSVGPPAVYLICSSRSAPGLSSLSSPDGGI